MSLSSRNRSCQLCTRTTLCVVVVLLVVVTAIACTLQFTAAHHSTETELFRDGCSTRHYTKKGSSSNALGCTTAAMKRIARSINQHNTATGTNRMHVEYTTPHECTICSPILRTTTRKHFSKKAHEDMSKIHAKVYAHQQRSQGQNAKMKATAVDQTRALRTLTGKNPPTRYQLQQDVLTVDGEILDMKERLRKLERFEKNFKR